VRDDAMWMHLDDATVKIPQQLLNQSQVLVNAMSAAQPSGARKVTLAAPKEWLQAWAGCFCNNEERLADQDIQVLVSCLLVRVLCLEWGCHPADICYSWRYSVRSLSSARHNSSTLPDRLKLII
jgi:hypothetical protein